MDPEGTELFDLFGETGHCTVCLEDLVEGDRVRTISACQHLFHAACLDEWFTRSKTCPTCRQALPAPSVQDMVATYQARIDAYMNRLYLTYIITQAILTTFKTAGAFNAQRDALRAALEGFELNNVRPWRFDLTQRSHVSNINVKMRANIASYHSSTRHGVGRLASVRDMKIAFEAWLATNPGSGLAILRPAQATATIS